MNWEFVFAVLIGNLITGLIVAGFAHYKYEYALWTLKEDYKEMKQFFQKFRDEWPLANDFVVELERRQHSLKSERSD